MYSFSKAVVRVGKLPRGCERSGSTEKVVAADPGIHTPPCSDLTKYRFDPLLVVRALYT